MLESMPRVSSLAVHTIVASHAGILHAQSPIVRASSRRSKTLSPRPQTLAQRWNEALGMDRDYHAHVLALEVQSRTRDSPGSEPTPTAGFWILDAQSLSSERYVALCTVSTASPHLAAADDGYDTPSVMPICRAKVIAGVLVL